MSELNSILSSFETKFSSIKNKDDLQKEVVSPEQNEMVHKNQHPNEQTPCQLIELIRDVLPRTQGRCSQTIPL